MKNPPNKVDIFFCQECGFYDCYSEPAVCIVCAPRAEVRLVRVRCALRKRAPRTK